jgi:hypothetical protein
VDLPDQASRALDALRRTASELRFDVEEICHSSRWRLSVRYTGGPPGAPGSDEFRLGLLYSEDRSALEELRARLAEAESRRPQP